MRLRMYFVGSVKAATEFIDCNFWDMDYFWRDPREYSGH